MDPIKASYKSAKQRCQNPKNPSFCNYGGRGIEFRFNSLKDFENCLGKKPDSSFTVERLNNDGHYENGNIVWASKTKQVNNRRLFKNNSSGIKGIHYKSTHNAWVARAGIKYKRITLYHGKDFFEACCARKKWENISLIQ